ncbi:MAG: glycosyltransferase family 39 protein [Chloroflexota bacterium]
MNFTRREWMLLLMIITVAAAMRLARPGIVEFKHDEAYLSLLALDALAAGDLPMLGMPSSVGIPNAPTSVWLMMLPYAVTNNPLVATLFVAMLNMVGVSLLFLLAKRLFTTHVAVIAALLYAVNPWAVLYSRKIWAQDMHTPFILLALWLGVIGFMDGRRAFQVLTLPVLVLAMQTHYAAWTLLPVYLALLYFGRKIVSIGAVALSVVLSALFVLPFGMGIWQTWQANPALFSSLSGGNNEAITMSIEAWLFHLRLLSGAGITAMFSGPGVRWYDIMWRIAFGAAATAGLIHLWRSVRPRSTTIFVSLWIFVPVLVFTPTWTAVFPHYFIPTLPALCMMIALGVVWLTHAVNARVVYGLLSILLLSQAVVWFGLLNITNNNAQNGEFGLPLHYRLDVREALADEDDIVLVSDGYRTLLDAETAIWAVMTYGNSCLRTVSTDGFTVLPPERFVTLTEPDSPTRDLYLTDSPQEFSLPGGTAFAIHEHDAPAWDDRHLPAIDPLQFDNDVRLLGMNFAGNILQLEWELPASSPGDDFQYFAHFIDANDERIGQRDGEFLPGRWWCEGDRLITQIDVNAPPETVMLQVGMYRFTPDGGFKNANVIDEAGNPINIRGDVPLR